SDGAPTDHFDLEEQHERLERRLRFLSTLSRLWQIAARWLTAHPSPRSNHKLQGWLVTAGRNNRRLLELLDALHAHPLPEPSGDHDSLVEYDRRRVLKEQLIYTTINTCLDTSLAVGAMRGSLGENGVDEDAPGWEADAIRLEQALFSGDRA